jgi:cell division protein FtsB
MDLIIALLLVIILGLALLSGFLFFRYAKMNEQIEAFLTNSNAKDLRESILAYIKKVEALDKEIQKTEDRVKHLEGIAKISFQKVGIVRFNPFRNFGGDQSFVIALLDGKNNGFVMSSIFTEQGSRVYSKSVVGGKSRHTLSKEEE